MAEPKKKTEEEKKKKKEEREARIKEKEKEWKGLQEKDEDKEKEGKPKREAARSGFKLDSRFTLPIIVASVILISIIVCRLMVPILAPTISDFGSFQGDVAESFTYLDEKIDEEVEEVRGEIPDISNLVSTFQLNQLRGDLDDTIDEVEWKAALNADNITAIRTDIASQVKALVESTLSGTFGSYTLKARAGEAGNFTARLNLVYTPARNVGVANSTLEEALLSFSSSWVTSIDKDYLPSLVFDSRWKVSGVSFLVGKFSLGAVNSTSISITFTGLNVTPDYVFAEVFPVL